MALEHDQKEMYITTDSDRSPMTIHPYISHLAWTKGRTKDASWWQQTISMTTTDNKWHWTAAKKRYISTMTMTGHRWQYILTFLLLPEIKDWGYFAMKTDYQWQQQTTNGTGQQPKRDIYYQWQWQATNDNMFLHFSSCLNWRKD